MNKLFKCLVFSAITALSVQAAPDVTSVTIVGKTATISVTADGTLPFTYQWSKDGVNVAASGVNASQFVIAPVSLASAGTYKVTVSNSAGSTISPLAILKVMSPPVIVTNPANATVQLGKPIAFVALANSTPEPTYQWLKNGVAISGATASTYNIAAATAADAGSYSCVATSTLDTLVMTATTTVATLTTTAAPPVITGISITIQ